LSDTHEKAHILVEKLRALLSEQAAPSATALGGDSLTPLSYTGGSTGPVADGLPSVSHGDSHGDLVFVPLDNSIAAEPHDSAADDTADTGNSVFGLAAAAGGTETTHGDSGDAELPGDADVTSGEISASGETGATGESTASATAPGKPTEPTPSTSATAVPAPSGESGQAATDPVPTPATTADSGTISVDLGAVSAPTPAPSDTVSVDLGPLLSVAGTLSVDLAPPSAPSTAAAVDHAATTPPSVSAVPPAAVYHSDSDSGSSTRFAPPKFQGLTTENAKDWIREFDNYCLYKDMNGAKKLALFKVLLTSSAAIWLENLPAATTNSWENVKAAFETRYNPPGFLKYKHANDLFNKKQENMSVDDFCAQMQHLAREVGAAEDMLRFAVINGFNPEIRNHVTRAQPTTWTELVQQAKVGEMCMPVPSGSDPILAVKLEASQDQLTQLTLNKTRTASPVCFAGRSESRGRSSRP